MPVIELALDSRGVRVARLLVGSLKEQALAGRVLNDLEPDLQQLQRRVRAAYAAAREKRDHRASRSAAAQGTGS